MDDEKLMQEIDAAYMRAKHGKAYLGDEMGKAIASGQKASHAANEWMMLRAEARRRGLIPDLGGRADLAQAPAPVRVELAAVLSDLAANQKPMDLGITEAEWEGLYESEPAALEAPDAGVVAELVEALRLADAALSGANMNMDVVEKKVKAALVRVGVPT